MLSNNSNKWSQGECGVIGVLSRYKAIARMCVNIWSIRNQSDDIVLVILSAVADGDKNIGLISSYQSIGIFPYLNIDMRCGGMAWHGLAIGNRKVEPIGILNPNILYVAPQTISHFFQTPKIFSTTSYQLRNLFPSKG